MDIIEQKENPLLKRKEVIVSLKYDKSTPSKAEMQALMSKHFRTEPTRVEIKKIMTDFGAASGKMWVNIWQDKEIPLYGKKEEKTEEAKQ